MASSIAFKLLDLKLANIFSIFITLFLAVLFCGILIFLKHAFRRKKFSKLIPCKSVGLFNVLGNAADLFIGKAERQGYSINVFLLQVLSGYTELFRDKKLFCFWISYSPFVVFVKAEAVEELICGTKMLQKSWTYDWLHPWLGTGLLTREKFAGSLFLQIILSLIFLAVIIICTMCHTDVTEEFKNQSNYGPKWKSRRKLLTPSFHFEILKDFLPVFNEQSQILVKFLKKETKKPWTDVIMPVTLCSLDIICETTLGVTISAQQNSDSHYVKCVLRASEVIMERMVSPQYWVDWIFAFTERGRQFKSDLKLLHNFTRTVIQEKKKKLLCGDAEIAKRKRKALMDLLLEHHLETKSLSEEDIREEVDTFTFEGHDTTSMGISWALYLIGLNEEVQAKLHEEMDRIFGDDTERPVTTDDLKDMNYLDCVLKESQRLYPSVPMIGRHVSEDTKFCGYTIPKGASCAVLTYELHRDKDVFPDPEKFDPDRFLPENSLNRHPYAYIPFSAGPRNCIGQRFAIMEEKTVVCHILRNYTLESLDPRDTIPPAPELILRSSKPIRIKFRSRYPKES